MASSGSDFDDFLVAPHKCYATGNGLQRIVKFGESVSAILHVVDIAGEPYTKPVKNLICELVSEESTGEKIVCSVGKTEASGEYDINYNPINQGRHQLHIKVKGEHIKESPFSVFVLNLDTAKYAIIGEQIDSGESVYKLRWPNGVAVNSVGDIVVVERGAHCVSVFIPVGEKLIQSLTFGSFGSQIGEFNEPRGVAVDDKDNILVVDSWNHRIQKFTSGGKFITTSERLFQHPAGIAIHPSSKRVYVADNNNHCVTILNRDLILFDFFGHGRFRNPYDVAFDSTGRVYVADQNIHRIQIFTAEGKYLMQFGSHGSGDGKLNGPNGICIDGDDVLYVTEWHNNRISLFSCQHVGDGLVPQFLKSFGTLGNKQGQFKSPYGIALNLPKTHIYVTDLANNRIQIFNLKKIR
jgi:DNA-binding beta-propeller fold protein YncE